MPDSFTRVRQVLEPLADPARAAEMTAYMRGRFPFLGVGAPARRKATTPILRALRDFDADLVTACFVAEQREYQYVACDHIRRVGITDLDLAERLVGTKSWWDTVDALAKPIGANHADGTMRAWAVHVDLWVRRVVILHQLGRKTDTDRDLLAWIIRQNLGSGEFFINKAIGWALRDLAHHDPSWVRVFVDVTDLHSLSRREALKNLCPPVPSPVWFPVLPRGSLSGSRRGPIAYENSQQWSGRYRRDLDFHGHCLPVGPAHTAL